MTVIKRSALLPYPAMSIFELVSDIEAYPRYMDGCVGAQILHRTSDLVEARLDLARAGIAQSFSTRNRLVGHESIELELIDGPFERFRGFWQFQGLGDMACKVSLDLEFSFNNNLLGAAAAKLFDSVTANLVDAVSRRAKQLYG